MKGLDQLDCAVYIEAPFHLDELARMLSQRAQTGCELGEFEAVLRLPLVEIVIRQNEDSAEERAAEYPDGFLFFRYRVEFFINAESRGADHVALVNELLKSCWEQGWPAVASCAYEDELAEGGGYNNPNTPWPGKILAQR